MHFQFLIAGFLYLSQTAHAVRDSPAPQVTDSQLDVRDMGSQHDLSTLLDSVKALGNYKFEDEGERRKAMNIARASVVKLESSYDRIIDMWAETARDAAIKTLINVNAWAKWENGAPQQSSKQLAAMTGVHPALMASLLKHLAAMYVINEDGPDLYSLNDFSRALARPEIAACVGLQFNLFLPSFTSMPDYFKSLDYSRPENAKDAAFAYAFHFNGTIFDFMKSHPQTAQSYEMTMIGFNTDRPGWTDVYAPTNLTENYDPDTALLVDLGGGLGNDILKFQQALPKNLQSPKRLILQDQPQVLEKVQSTAITKMPHDFFTKEPVKGARAYFMHSITHDWPDEDVRKILSSIKPAMKPGYSRILIYDNVIADVGADVQTTSFDLIMMAGQGGKERTEEQFEALFRSVGLRTVKVWTSDVAAESLIEVALASDEEDA